MCVRHVPERALEGVCDVRGSGRALASLTWCGFERVVGSIYLLRVGACVCDGFISPD